MAPRVPSNYMVTLAPSLLLHIPHFQTSLEYSAIDFNRHRSFSLFSHEPPPPVNMTTTMTKEVFDNDVVPSALAKISPILRVAEEIETDRPRVAYLCRSYASEKANRLDPSSTGSDVSQFKTLLLQRLERDKASSLASRVKETDTREIESFYHQYYEDNVVRAVDQGEQLQAYRAQLGKPYQTAGVLFEVLCAVKKTENVEEVAAVEVAPDEVDDIHSSHLRSKL